jgi:hypothetical protein
MFLLVALFPDIRLIINLALVCLSQVADQAGCDAPFFHLILPPLKDTELIMIDRPGTGYRRFRHSKDAEIRIKGKHILW